MALCLPPNPVEAHLHAAEILGDPELLQRCADDSSFHRNGFTKVVLIDSPLSGRTRLHYWPRAALVPGDEDIHSHRWPFSSAVLQGTFREHLYRVEPGGPDLVGRYTKHDSERKLTGIEAVTIEEFDRRLMQRGKRISRRPGLFHRLVHLGDRPGLTLVRTGPAEKEYSLVARRAAQGTEVDPGRPVEPAMIERILVEFISLEAMAA